MRIVRSIGTLRLSYAFSFLLLFTGCEKHIDVDYGPCEFAPPESKFPVFPHAYCNECYFNLQFGGKEYSFAGNQFESEAGAGAPILNSDKDIMFTKIQNSFLSFYLVSPSSDEALKNSLNVRTPLLSLDTLYTLADYPPPVSASIGLYNYCNDLFEPIGNIEQSFHQLTDTELIESYIALIGHDEIDLQSYQVTYYYCFGELEAIFTINNETQTATASYKLRMQILEKI